MSDRRMIILGGDGYLGWPAAMHFARRDWTVHAADNYFRRATSRNHNAEALFDNPTLLQRCDHFRSLTSLSITPHIFDCTNYEDLAKLVRFVQPNVIIHFAEQPSAPFSMRDFEAARFTLNNNLNTTFNVIWAILENAPECHLIKLGTMGEYGTPNIDIEEGWIDITHKGRQDRFLFPRQGPSLYHTTKIMDTDLIHFYVRTRGLKATDLMQGPVYGIHTAETRLSPHLWTNFHYDDIFGTVLNRFVVQAIAREPLTVYGAGTQRRGFLNLIDTLQCIGIAAETPPRRGELVIANQFTEVFSVLDLADRVIEAAADLGINAELEHVANPRAELDRHYFNPAHQHFRRHGLVPHLLTREVVIEMLETVAQYADRIDRTRMRPRIVWGFHADVEGENPEATAAKQAC